MARALSPARMPAFERDTTALFEGFSAAALASQTLFTAEIGVLPDRPSLLVIAAGRAFIVDPAPGVTAALQGRETLRLDAVLLTRATADRLAGLSELAREHVAMHGEIALPVFGPREAATLVARANDEADVYEGGLELWGPAPTPRMTVGVFEQSGVVISAFASDEHAPIGYRFECAGRSLECGGWRGARGSEGAVADGEIARLKARPRGATMAARLA